MHSIKEIQIVYDEAIMTDNDDEEVRMIVREAAGTSRQEGWNTEVKDEGSRRFFANGGVAGNT